MKHQKKIKQSTIYIYLGEVNIETHGLRNFQTTSFKPSSHPTIANTIASGKRFPFSNLSFCIILESDRQFILLLTLSVQLAPS